MDFFTSPTGVAIAWFCTVASFIYGFVQKSEKKKLKAKVLQLGDNNTNLTNEIKDLKAKIDLSTRTVTQNGEKSIYTDKVVGGMKVEM